MEGGTPAISESIRAGLVFPTPRRVGLDSSARGEAHFIRRAIVEWEKKPTTWNCSATALERLPIGRRRQSRGKHLHHKFVVAFSTIVRQPGRGGCSCAGVRFTACRHRSRSSHIERQNPLAAGGHQPGWVRVHFNYL